MEFKYTEDQIALRRAVREWAQSYLAPKAEEIDVNNRFPTETIKALGVTEDVTKMPVLRPLIGTDKVEIIRMAREIGTYETSILPYEDCCTVFTPRHPATRPVLEDVVQAESVLDIDGLVAKALEGETWVRVKP